MARNIPYLDTAQAIGRVVNGRLVPEAWFVDAWNDLLNRTGGQTTNTIAVANVAAAQAQATTTALAAGAVTTGYVLSPSAPVTVSYSSRTGRLIVAPHTRDEGGTITSLPAGSVVDPVPRGDTYYVYYDTPYVTAPTYLATTDPSLLVPASIKLIQTVTVEESATVGGSNAALP